MLREELVGTARRAAEQLVEARVGHPQAGAIVEVALVEAEAAVGLEVDQMVEDLLAVARYAVRREAHQLVLAGIHLEPGVVREGGVEKAQRMREVDLALHLERGALAEREGRRRPFAHAVHGEDRGLVERRGEVRRRRMALVVLGEEEALLPVDAGGVAGELVAQQLLLEQLLLQPERNRHPERAEAARREREVRFEEPLELEEGLVVEGDVIDRLDVGPAFGEAIVDRVARKARVVLAPAEALLLRGGDDAPVLDQRRGAVVVEGGNSEDSHRGGTRWGPRVRTACR